MSDTEGIVNLHTPGPWSYEHGTSDHYHIHDTNGLNVASTCDRMKYESSAAAQTWEEDEANARLIANAPAYKLALDMIATGVARIERSPTCSLVEFCFAGMRYPVNDGDYSSVLDVIGWGKARAALADAKGGA